MNKTIKNPDGGADITLIETKPHYYGFKFFSGRHTTTGEMNPRTYRMSIAGEIKVFKTKLERDKSSFVPVTKKELRKLCLGMTADEFSEHLKMLIKYCDCSFAWGE